MHDIIPQNYFTLIEVNVYWCYLYEYVKLIGKFSTHFDYLQL